MLDGNCPFQHRFHNRIVGSIAYPAYINQPVALCNQRVYLSGVVTDDALARCFYPATKAAGAIRNRKRR